MDVLENEGGSLFNAKFVKIDKLLTSGTPSVNATVSVCMLQSL